MAIKTIEDAEALVGKTFGSGKDARTVDRIENLHMAWGTVTGNVYWGRPGGKVRAQSQYLPYFKDWLRKIEKEAKRTPISCRADVEAAMKKVPLGATIEGYIERHGNKVTIIFEEKSV